MVDGGLENGKAKDRVLEDGGLENGVSGGVAELNFVNSKEDGKKSSRHRRYWKQVNSPFVLWLLNLEKNLVSLLYGLKMSLCVWKQPARKLSPVHCLKVPPTTCSKLSPVHCLKVSPATCSKLSPVHLVKVPPATCSKL